ncbi:hypothetical protein AMECASPLE_000292 [Ameca splendens]|uniref:Secreted protein n=1 Tax=Ameca splendens TaxID=208324 RepID=A0ABV0XXK1_9TELE
MHSCACFLVFFFSLPGGALTNLPGHCHCMKAISIFLAVLISQAGRAETEQENREIGQGKPRHFIGLFPENNALQKCGYSLNFSLFHLTTTNFNAFQKKFMTHQLKAVD